MIAGTSDLEHSLHSSASGLRIQTDPEVLEAYRFDQAQFVGAGTPAAVAFPTSTEEVAAIVRHAFENEIPLVARGAGSGLSGGANAIDGCIVISLQNMRSILEVDVEDQLAVVQPGVINADLKNAARAIGLHYPPDPASYQFSTIGGNISTNAGGLCCIKYGVTADYVFALEVVLGDGRIIRTGRRTRKGVAGYDLTRLLVGSEGTLGIVTEATLRLRPPPMAAATLVASFPLLEGAGLAITRITASLVPSMLELLDRTTMQAIEEWKPVGLDTEAEAMLIVQADGSDADTTLRLAEEICNSSGASLCLRSSDEMEAEMLLEARRLAFPSLERQGSVLLDDVGVPPSKLAALLSVIPDIAQRHGVLVATFGHAGDGNMHPTIVFDGNDPDAVASARDAFNEIVEEALRLGGTSTGEHGVGSLKRSFLQGELGEDVLKLHAGLKQVFDPRGILNPGKAF